MCWHRLSSTYLLGEEASLLAPLLESLIFLLQYGVQFLQFPIVVLQGLDL